MFDLETLKEINAGKRTITRDFQYSPGRKTENPEGDNPKHSARRRPLYPPTDIHGRVIRGG